MDKVWFDPMPKQVSFRRCKGCGSLRTDESEGECPVCQDIAFKDYLREKRIIKLLRRLKPKPLTKEEILKIKRSIWKKKKTKS
jgi:hypothetical protein